MNRDDKDLQSVLDEMFASGRELDFKVVRAWQIRYPQYEREIAEAVNDQREFEFFALADDLSETEPLSETAERAMKKALAETRPPADEIITDLRETAKKKGIRRDFILKSLGASETLLRKIERRNLKEFPERILQKLSEIYRVSTNSLNEFFALPPTLPQAARYKSKTTPRTVPKQSFAAAVRTDPELNAEEKQKLLDLT